MKYEERIQILRERKIEQTQEKLDRLGYQNEDDYGMVLPPLDHRWRPPLIDENGSFHGAKMWGKNYRSLMETHPVYIDPNDAFAGRWMYMLHRLRPNYKLSLSPFPFDYSHLRETQLKYDITPGIGKDAHFSPDYAIGLHLGWGGLLEKVRKAKSFHNANSDAIELLGAEEDVILGVIDLIGRSAEEAARMVEKELDVELKKNLMDMFEINKKLELEPPSSFREACQWIIWFNIASRNYNRDGAGGQLDELLRPYYEKDILDGIITQEDVIFYLFCFLLNDTHYYQISGPDSNGNDLTSEISYLILEAADKLKSSCNLTIRVHEGTPDDIIDRGIRCLLKNRLGYPRFSGDKALIEGFVKNGFSKELARSRIAVGCNWMSIPGREYALNDLIKVNIAKVFEVAFDDLITNTKASEGYSTEVLFQLFQKHLAVAVACTIEGVDFHLKHQYLNEPELLLNLLSHGPIEKGLDASHGGLEYYNIGIDGAGLATVSDSFAAIEQRIEQEKKITWMTLSSVISNNFEGPEGERIRLLLKSSDRFGRGHSLGDKWAKTITEVFTREIIKYSEQGKRIYIPGWFSWADTVRLGEGVGPTPNGRKAKEPINHGANPYPGYRNDGALTALVKAVAMVQPGYGNTAPLQIELDPNMIPRNKQVETIRKLIMTHFALGGTLININVIDANVIRKAYTNPQDYPELIVRVTGFTAYFANLSPDFRKLVLERAINKEISCA